MAFEHGTYTQEKESQISGLTTVTNPIFVVGTAPINMGDITNYNKAQLITSIEEATNIFGGLDVPGFTITETLELAFRQYKAGPIIAVNVLNPDDHSETNIETALVVTKNKVTLEKLGIIKSTLEITNESVTPEPPEGYPVLVLDTDYTVEFKTTGELVVTIIKADVTKVGATYDWLDTSLVTDLDIIGGVELGTTNRTGMECIDDVFMKYKMIPGIPIAPGYDTDIEVISQINNKSKLFNNKYGAYGICQLPDDIEYSAAIEEKAKLNILYPDVTVVYGKLKYGDKIQNHSAHLACLMVSTDNSGTNGGVPFESPSNKLLAASSLVIKRNGVYEEVRLDEVTQANLLNENGISTALVRPNGFVHWGNRTSAFQPGGITDPKDIWVPIKRMFKYVSNTVVINTSTDIDSPMDANKAAYIQRKINTWLDGLVTAGKLLGGRVEFTEEENPITNIQNGKFTWHIYLGGVKPMESAHFILEYDANYDTVIFTAVS